MTRTAKVGAIASSSGQPAIAPPSPVPPRNTAWCARVNSDFLHKHKDFASLLRIVADQMKVQPVLVEKDYWIMHCLYGL